MWGWIIFVLLLLLWWIAGGMFGGPPGGMSCDACRKLNDWWHGLSKAQKVLQAAQYAAKKATCFARGC